MSTPTRNGRPWLKKESYLKLKRFERTDLASNAHLTTSELVILLALTALCDYRWGTVSDLTEHVHISRRVVTTSITTLAERGLVQVRKPPTRNQQMCVRVLALNQLLLGVNPIARGELIKPAKPHLNAASPRRRHATRLRPIRDVHDTNVANEMC